jgi:hypothetical protein
MRDATGTGPVNFENDGCLVVLDQLEFSFLVCAERGTLKVNSSHASGACRRT